MTAPRDGLRALQPRLRRASGVARRWLADRLARVVLGPLAGKLPERSIRSVAEVAFREDVAAHVVAVRPWRRATVATYDLPPELGPSFRRDKAFDARALLELRDVVVSPRSGAVWLPGGPLVEESVGALRRIVLWGDVRPELTARPRPLPSEDILIPCPSTPFFHWVLEVLPGLIGALEHRPDATLLTAPEPPAHVRAGLELLRRGGLLRHEPRAVDGAVRIPRALVPAVEPFAGFLHPDDLDDLRRVVLPLADPGPPPTRRPYISRRRATARALSGEAALEAALTGAGVDVVHAEDLTLAEQVRLFADAELVIATHGAGLTNLVWSAGDAHVVEVFPHDYRNDCFARLAASVGASYDHVVADPDGSIDAEAVLRAARRRGPSPS